MSILVWAFIVIFANALVAFFVIHFTRRQGFNSGKHSLGRHLNPNRPGSPAWDVWDQGYDDGQNEDCV